LAAKVVIIEISARLLVQTAFVITYAVKTVFTMDAVVIFAAVVALYAFLVCDCGNFTHCFYLPEFCRLTYVFSMRVGTFSP
jgi:hypothetical protein